MKIFVLEDNADRIKHFYLLCGFGHELTSCNNAEDAKKIIQVIKFDVMYLDHDLGEPVDTNNGVTSLNSCLEKKLLTIIHI